VTASPDPPAETSTDRSAAAVAGARLPAARRRALGILLAVAALALVASTGGLHEWLVGFLPTAEAIIKESPVLGMSFFVMFAAASAMLAFVSSAVIVPVGIYVWGTGVSALLLWTGWIIGGLCAYAISRYFGRAIIRSITSGIVLERYEHLISQRAPFGFVLLFQLGLPSEVPGYVLGLARYPFWKYLAALALAELPYAIATIYLGASFIEGRPFILVAVGLMVATFSGWALYTLHGRISPKRV
jgi:uncharacterized membrane protein YdjX (TVP38/TMEM64 family)